MSTKNVMPELHRGMEIAFNIVKDGKKHTLKAIRAAFAKDKIKKGVIGRMYRLARMGRATKQFDIIIEHADGRQMAETSTFHMVKGAAAQKSIAEKNKRYSGLAEAHHKPAKKAAKKSAAKKHPAKKAAQKSASKKVVIPVAAKTAPKKTAAKKPAAKPVHAGHDAEASSEAAAS